MTDTNEFFVRGISAALIPCLLQVLCLFVASSSAKLLSNNPLYRDVARQGLLLIVLAAWWLLFAPWYSQAILRPGAGDFDYPPLQVGTASNAPALEKTSPEALGAAYGLHTIWIGYVAALFFYRSSNWSLCKKKKEFCSSI